MRDGIAVYPGTFDPFTRGHEDLVRRASRLFDKIIVGVATSGGKGPIFAMDERVDIAREVLAPYPNVEVQGFSCLLMEFLRQNNARVILRGLRAVSDFEYEFQMVAMNQRMNHEIETVFLMADPHHQAVSSRLVKEIARLGGSADLFVPEAVHSRLLAKFGMKKGK